MSYTAKSVIAAGLVALLLGGLALTSPSADASAQTPAPPPLAEDRLYQTNTVRTVLPGTIAQVRAFFDANPITDFVAPTDAIPAITGFTYLEGDWPAVGATRRVSLDGGHTVDERVLINTQDAFSYQIWNVTAPAGRFIDHIKGEFTYTQVDDTVEVVWSYNIKPKVFVARPFIGRYLTNDFGPFMRAGIEGLSAAYLSR